jgi:hypothetical protein
MRNPRRFVALVAAAAMTILPIGVASPSPSAGGLASDNVTYVTTVPFEVGAALTGARLVGDYLYVAGARSFSIYDVSDPLVPVLESITPTGPHFPNEDIDTNGRILLVSDQQIDGTLEVWDVEDKAAPVRLAVLTGVRDHTFTCVFRCSYAYGANGSIVDLRDPATPERAGAWGQVSPSDGYDTTEVAPGRILTATRTIYLLDARKDPLRPVIRAQGGTGDHRLIHSLRWPNRGTDRFFLVQGETPASQTCGEDSGAFMTWDTRGYQKTHTFRLLDEFRVTNGTVVDGNPPANGLGCTAMWFQEHPSFRNGGIVASAFFEHGARFLEVSPRGQISEVGYFFPAGGETIATYWITDEIVYAIDVTRGIDILRFDRPAE